MKRIILLRNDAGGEGSRGGHVIGHTSSGKPIYGKKGANYHRTKQGYTQKDHVEAALSLRNQATKAQEAYHRARQQGEKHHPGGMLSRQYDGFAKEHENLALYAFGKEHYGKSLKDLAKEHKIRNDAGGEGSRGGHVIGRTSSGKPNHPAERGGGTLPGDKKYALRGTGFGKQ